MIDAIEKAERRIKREKKKKIKLNSHQQFKKMNKNNRHKKIKMILTHFFEVVIKIEVKDNNIEQALRVQKKVSEGWFF